MAAAAQIIHNDRAEFEAFELALRNELAPEGTIENLTFEELLHAAWNLRRFRRIEADLSTGTADDFGDSPNAKALDRLSRHQTKAQKAYYQALKELRTLQTNRALRVEKLEDPADPRIPAITDINQLTKQTHSEVLDTAMRQAIRMVDFQGAVLPATLRKIRE